MSTTRKKKKTKKSGSSIIIPIIIILLAIIAAIAIYYLSEPKATIKKPKAVQIQGQPETPTNQPETTKSQPITKTTQQGTSVKPKPETKTFLEGTWVSQSNGAMLEFHDHTFNIDIPSVDSPNYQKGSFSINGKEITFSYNNGKVPCGEEKGVYTFRLSKDILHLKVKQDNCKTRRDELVAEWQHFSGK